MFQERRYWEEMRRYEEEMEYYEWNMVAHSRRMGPGMPPPPPHAMPLPPGGPRPGVSTLQETALINMQYIYYLSMGFCNTIPLVCGLTILL